MTGMGKTRIVIVGGGFGGAFAAQRLLKKGGDAVEVVVIDRNNYLTFYPLLVEAGVGSVEPRHVVVPLRRFLGKGRLIMAEVQAIDVNERCVRYLVPGSVAPLSLDYDHLILAPGSVTRMPPVPGLEDFGYQVKTIGDVIEHRDRGIRLLELAANVVDEGERRRLLTFVVVGGNYTGVEMAGEYHAFLEETKKAYPELKDTPVRMVLVERGDQLLGTVKPDLARWCQDTLAKRGVDVRLNESVDALDDVSATLRSGEQIPAETVIWAAGIAPSPLLAKSGLPLNERGYLMCTQELRVEGSDHVWGIGDSATVPNNAGKPYAPTAQNASRMGPAVAENILHAMRGEPLDAFHFEMLGSFAAIGHRQAVAEIKGYPVKGFLGWVMYRGAYLTKMPTFSRKVRLVMDWLLELVLPHEAVQLGVTSGKAGRTVRQAGVPDEPGKPDGDRLVPSLEGAAEVR